MNDPGTVNRMTTMNDKTTMNDTTAPDTKDADAAQVIRVLYFAQVAELTQKRNEDWAVNGPLKAADWLEQLLARYPQLAPASRLKLAINQDHAPLGATIRPGDEVAVFEPVTGG